MNTNPQDPFGFLDLASSDADIAKDKSKTDKRQQFPCGQCAGTGQYSGPRIHQEKSHCFACRGKGYFLTDPRKLQERKAKKAQTEKERKAGLLADFQKEHPDMFAELLKVETTGSTNGFILSLATQLFQKGSLSENQIAAWYRGKARLTQIQEEREAEDRKTRTEVDLTPIREMFETAVGNGYKRPVYRAEGLVISRAPDSGRNPGALYVKNENDAYGGKVIETTFHPSRDGRAPNFVEHLPATAAEALKLIASDPLEAALRYGQRTGRCACCGRELTNHKSIDLGIGPVCRAKWGL